ncbi:hypothetical protein R6Q59_035634 [Mikania micrantha]
MINWRTVEEPIRRWGVRVSIRLATVKCCNGRKGMLATVEKEEKRPGCHHAQESRTLFFLITMIISFLFFSAPILVAIADALLPAALLSASVS